MKPRQTRWNSSCWIRLRKMNDNEPERSLEGEMLYIIESFAPGYTVSLRSYASTKRAILKFKFVTLLTMTLSWIYLIFYASISAPATTMAMLVTVASAYGLCCIERLEREVGIWKLHYKSLLGTGLKYPYKWEFHPAEDRLARHRAAHSACHVS